jgi:hypothetical protein
MALLNIIPLAIVPCAGAHFKPEINHYIFCPSSAEQSPVVWCRKNHDQHTTSDMQMRQLPKKEVRFIKLPGEK